MGLDVLLSHLDPFDIVINPWSPAKAPGVYAALNLPVVPLVGPHIETLLASVLPERVPLWRCDLLNQCDVGSRLQSYGPTHLLMYLVLKGEDSDTEAPEP